MVLVVVKAPVLGQHLSLQQGVEELLAQQLVSDSGVERFDVCVLPGRPRLDEAGTGAFQAEIGSPKFGDPFSAKAAAKHAASSGLGRECM
jgi:hypothetical protein